MCISQNKFIWKRYFHDLDLINIGLKFYGAKCPHELFLHNFNSAEGLKSHDIIPRPYSSVFYGSHESIWGWKRRQELYVSNDINYIDAYDNVSTLFEYKGCANISIPDSIINRIIYSKRSWYFYFCMYTDYLRSTTTQMSLFDNVFIDIFA